MRVYSVVEVRMDPHGEDMGLGASYGLYASRKGANAYVKELEEAHIFNFTDRKHGGLRVRMPQYKVVSVRVED